MRVKFNDTNAPIEAFCLEIANFFNTNYTDVEANINKFLGKYKATNPTYIGNWNSVEEFDNFIEFYIANLVARNEQKLYYYTFTTKGALDELSGAEKETLTKTNKGKGKRVSANVSIEGEADVNEYSVDNPNAQDVSSFDNETNDTRERKTAHDEIMARDYMTSQKSIYQILGEIYEEMFDYSLKAY